MGRGWVTSKFPLERYVFSHSSGDFTPVANFLRKGKIVLGLHNVLMPRYYNRRIFEGLATPSAFLVNYVDHMEADFENWKDLVWFNLDDVDELIEKAQQLLKDWKEIAKRGQEKYKKEWTMDKWAEKLVKIIKEYLEDEGWISRV